MSDATSTLQPYAPPIAPQPPAGALLGRWGYLRIKGQGDPMQMAAIAEGEGWADMARYSRLEQKTAVDPVTYPSLASAMRPVTLDLELLLRSRSIVGQLADRFRRLPVGAHVLRQTGATTATFTGEGRPFALSADSFQDVATFSPFKLTAGLIVTAEVLRLVDARNFQALGEDLAAAIGEGFDRHLIDPAYAAIANLQPAAITRAATTRIVATGSTLALLDGYFEQMIDGLVAAGMPLTSAAWVFHPSTLARMCLMRGTGGAPAYPTLSMTGGTLAGLPVAVSAAASSAGSPSERLAMLLEASQLLVAGDDTPRLDVARNATAQLSDTPSDGAQAQVSLWQNNLAGLRATLYCDFAVRNPGAVALLEGLQF